MGEFINKYTSFKKREMFEKADYTKGSLNYDGKNIIEFLENLEREEINDLLDELLSSEDLDERMEIAEQILQVIEDNYVEIYDQVEDDIKDLAIE